VQVKALWVAEPIRKRGHGSDFWMRRNPTRPFYEKHGYSAQLRRLLDQLEPGDVLTVARLNGLARSTRDLLNTLDAIITGEGRFPVRG
jgi:hypothetical protein